MEKIQTNESKYEFRSSNPIELLQDVSGLDPGERAVFNKFVLQARKVDLPNDDYEAARLILDFLKKEGIGYAESGATLQDIFSNKKGNCLGLTLLIGALLKDRGFQPEFKAMLNIHDATHEASERILNEWVSGHGEIKQDTPLPLRQQQDPSYRFVPSNHPVLLLDGCVLETTSIAGESRPEDVVEAERVAPVSFEQVASYIYWERAGRLMKEKEFSYLEVQKILNEGLALSPDNREILSLKHDAAVRFFDDDGAEEARRRFLEVDGRDSFFLFEKYRIEGDVADLEDSLRLNPVNIRAFVEKNVRHARDILDAQFYFTVASHCVANSQSMDLKRFYVDNSDVMAGLYDKETLTKLFSAAGVREAYPLEYYIAMFRVRGDNRFLTTAIDERGLWPSTPLEQLRLCLIGRGIVEKCDRELEKMRREYAGSRLFQEAIETPSFSPLLFNK